MTQSRLRSAVGGDHRVLIGLLVVGFIVRVALLAGTTSTPLRIVDEQHYAQLGSNLANGHGLAWAPGQLTSMRPPLYPLFIAAVWTVTGSESLQAVRAAQIPLALLIVCGVYLLALRLFDGRTAITAAAVVCFYPSLLFSGILILTEVLFTLMLVALAIEYEGLLRRPRYGLALAVGATLGLAALTRSVMWPFVLVIVPLLGFSLGGALRYRVSIAACALLGFVVVVTPWTARNTQLQGTLTVIDNMGGMNLRMGNYEHTPEDRMWDAVSLTGERSWSYNLRAIRPESAGWTDGEKEKWAQREAIAYMLANPVTTARRSVLKFADFWGLEREMLAGFQQGLYRPPSWVMWFAVLAVVVAYPVVALGSVIGAAARPPSSPATHVLLAAIVLFVTVVHSIVFGHSRYHLPLVAFLAIYAAAAWTTGAWRDLGGRGRRALATLGCGGLIAMWSYEVWFRDADRARALLSLFI